MKKFIKWIFYILIALIIIGYIAGRDKKSDNAADSRLTAQSAETSQPAESEQKDIYQTTARKLFNAYADNEVATDEEMKGKLVAVTGIVNAIDKNFADSIIISLKTANEFMPARMAMKDSEKSTALTLKKGKQVVIVCEHMSRLVGSPSGRNCVFN